MNSSSRWAVPQNWAWAPVGELADVTGGGTPSAKDPMNFVDDGGVPWITPADLTGYNDAYISRGKRNLSDQGYTKSSAKLLPTGAVLFTSRAPIGYCAIASNPIATNQGFKSLTLFGGISAEYTRHYLKWSKPFLETLASGTTFLELSGSKLQKAPFPLPPLAEQKRIVAKLDALSARSTRARAELDRIDTLVKRYKQAVLSKAFSGEMTKDWREEVDKDNSFDPDRVFDICVSSRSNRKKQPKGFINRLGVSFPTLPFHWVYKTIHQLYDQGWIVDYADGNHGSLYPREHEFGSAGVCYVTASQVREGRVHFSECFKLNDSKAKQLRKGWAKQGDVLFTHNATVGRVAHVDEAVEDFLLGTSVTFYRLNILSIEPKYFFYLMQSPVVVAQYRASMEQTTRNQVPITAQAFLEVPVTSLEEQKEIVRRIENAFQKIDKLAAEAKRALELTDKLDEAILAKAFRGDLVPQDPNDEPASRLLDRIKAERAAAPKPKRGRGKKG